MHYGRKSGSSLIRTEAKSYAITMFIFGLIMPGIDNYAHAGGFLRRLCHVGDDESADARAR